MAKDRDDWPGENEAVGYRRPPKEHQIKTGEVRNQWGRKGKPRPKIDFLDEPFKICIDGEWITTTRRLGLDHALFNFAMAKGRVSNVQELERRSRERALEACDNSTGEATTPDEQAALDRYLHRRLKELEADANVKEDQKRETPRDNIESRGAGATHRKPFAEVKK